MTRLSIAGTSCSGASRVHVRAATGDDGGTQAGGEGIVVTRCSPHVCSLRKMAGLRFPSESYIGRRLSEYTYLVRNQ